MTSSLSTIASKFSRLFASGVASRGLTFALNTSLARSDPAHAKLFGLSHVQFWLLYTTSLSLSREGIRRACLRSPSYDAHLPLMSFVVGVGLVVPLLLVAFEQLTYDELEFEGVSLSEYVSALRTVALAVVVELAAEPFFLSAMARDQYTFRSVMEGVAVLCRALTTYYLVSYANMGIHAFSFGYLAYSVAILAGYVSRSSFTTSSPPPPTTTTTEYGVVASMMGQQLWKALLAESEKFSLLTSQQTLTRTGAFSLVTNLGSLAIRIVFAPFEELVFTAIGRADSKNAQRNVFTRSVDVAAFVSLSFAVFRTFFSGVLLLLLFGGCSVFASHESARVLEAYCVYVGLVALNGTLECLVQAVGSASELRIFNGFLVGGSLTYVVLVKNLFSARLDGILHAGCLVVFP